MRQEFAGFLVIQYYRYKILVFLIALFVAITFAHPQFFVTDEMITANQLAQIHSGHQVLVNEGKYGFFENGTPTIYFVVKNNLLGYSIFLPLISMPAQRIVDWIGNQFAYYILILWTFIPFCIGFLLKYFLDDPRTFGNRTISSIIFIASFFLFLINLFYYIPFVVLGKTGMPEALAIVLTNTLFYALLAVIIYCILFEIFSDVGFSLFGTFVCISCSSYLVWSTSMKDHMLVALLYGVLLASVVFYYKRNDRWFFPVSCIIIGLMAWARPELALPTFIGTVAFYWLTYSSIISRPKRWEGVIFFICAPLFVLIGALPFFINNFFITGNPLLPTWAVWPIQNSSSPIQNITSSGSLVTISINPIEKIMQIIKSDMAIYPDTILKDLYGVLFNPQNGSMGVFALNPLFLLALFLIPIFIFTKYPSFSQEEKFLLFTMGLFSFLVFAAYVTQIHGLHISPGCVPDIRYLSPAYLSLNIFGLIILKKIHKVSKNPVSMLKLLLQSLVIILPLAIIFDIHFYSDPGSSWPAIFYPLDTIASLMIYFLIFVFLLLYLLKSFWKKYNTCWEVLLLLAIISIPFIWQVLTSVNSWYYGRGLGGYTFWIPIVRKLCLLRF